MLVICTNMKIFISSYLVNFWLLFFMLGSIAFYFVVFIFESSVMTMSE